MTDGDLLQTGHVAGEELQIVEVEVVAGVDAQAQTNGVLAGAGEGGDGVGGVRGEVLGEGAGVELDAVGADGFGAVEHALVGVDEEGGADAGGF